MNQELCILNDSLVPQGWIDDSDSNVITLRHGDISQMAVHINSQKNNAEYLIKDNIAYNKDIRDYPFIITEAPSTFDAKGTFKDIVGYDVFHLFKNRCANITTSDVVYTGKTVEYIIKDVLTTTLSGDRAFSYISIAANADLGSTINMTIKPGQDLYSLIVFLLAIDNLGLKGTLGASSIEIDVYEGADRSQGNTDGNKPVVFSIKFNNLTSGETTDSSTFAKNFAYVLGSDGAGGRVVRAVGMATGNTRREVVVDGGDETDTDALDAIGQAAITESEKGATYEVSALNGSFTYGVDYFLGDIVTVEGENLRITRGEIVREAGKAEGVYLTFGQPIKTSSDQISELETRVTKLETKAPSAGGGGGGSTDGWIPANETWTYVSTDGPVGVVKVNANVTGKYSPKVRFKFTNNDNIIYGICVLVGTYGGDEAGYTYIYFLHEINPANSLALHLMAASDITENYYSNASAPTGFPSEIDKWTVYEDVADYSNAAATNNTYYNIGSKEIPIGDWILGWEGSVYCKTNSLNTWCAARGALSTTNDSASDTRLFFSIGHDSPSSYQSVSYSGKKDRPITLASKTTYYLNYLGYTGTGTVQIKNSVAIYGCRIFAICGYL